jgi:hypothetical protein
VIRIQFNLGELPGAAIFIMERSWRLNAKRYRWKRRADMRMLGRIFADLAQLLRAELQRRENSPMLPAADIALSDDFAERAEFLSSYFAQEAERLIEIRSRQEQSQLEKQILDLKDCAMDCYRLDGALAQAFAEIVRAGSAKQI